MYDNMSTAITMNNYLLNHDNYPAISDEDNIEPDADISSISSPPLSEQDFDSVQGSKGSNDDEDEGFDMEYLNEKRQILKRYCDAMKSIEAYTSAISNVPIEDDSDSIWSKAKEVMKDLSDSYEHPNAPEIFQSRPEIMYEFPPSKRQCVDTSNVTLVSSNFYNEKISPGDESIQRKETISEIHNLIAFYNTALECPISDSASMDSSEGMLESARKQNPLIRNGTGELMLYNGVGPMSPFTVSEANNFLDMTMEDALMISEKARYVKLRLAFKISGR
jgi:hypothetical protein